MDVYALQVAHARQDKELYQEFMNGRLHMFSQEFGFKKVSEQLPRYTPSTTSILTHGDERSVLAMISGYDFLFRCNFSDFFGVPYVPRLSRRCFQRGPLQVSSATIGQTIS